MNIQYFTNYDEMSQRCSTIIIESLKENSNQLLCAATGNSPEGVYKNLADAFVKNPEIFNNLKIVKLDEWGGIPATHPNSCETYIKRKILRPLNISNNRYVSFESTPDSQELECGRVQMELKQKGPIDICVLGLGRNGHIGFNEPADVLIPYCHVARLSQESLHHQMVEDMQNKPTHGLTLGMADILQSGVIILLATGPNKKNTINDLLTEKINTGLPASFLWLHPNVHCFVDSSVM